MNEDLRGIWLAYRDLWRAIRDRLARRSPQHEQA
jgi:hypothetical protein